MQKEILKEIIKENYAKIALKGNLDSCCGPHEVCDTNTFLKNKCCLLLDITIMN